MKLSLITLLGTAGLALGLVACGDDSDESRGTPSSGAAQGGGGSSMGGNGGDASGGGGATTGGNGGAGGAVAMPTVSLKVTPTSAPPASTLDGTVTVTDFLLEEPVNQPNQAGHGHFHVYLDGASGGNYLVAGQTAAVSIPIGPNVQPGPHTLHITLSDNHHVPLNPVVEDFVDITIE